MTRIHERSNMCRDDFWNIRIEILIPQEHWEFNPSAYISSFTSRKTACFEKKLRTYFQMEDDQDQEVVV